MQWRISAIFSKIKHEKPRIRGIIFIGSRRKLAFIRIQMNRIKGFEEADIMLKHFLNDSSLPQPLQREGRINLLELTVDVF